MRINWEMANGTTEDKRAGVALRGGMIQSALDYVRGREEGMRGPRDLKARAAGASSLMECQDEEDRGRKDELKR